MNIPFVQRLPRGWFRQRLRWLSQPAWFGTMRRTTPLSQHWGRERGLPIDRYYIENFLQEHRPQIRGRVLEVKDSGYTNLFGSDVIRADILDIDASNTQATLLADLNSPELPQSDLFDCFILTQTLQFTFEINHAVANACRLLKPGGVLLATLPGLSQIDRSHAEHDIWRFTPNACQKLFGDVFGTENTSVKTYGNAFSACAFLMGMAKEELSSRELDAHDPYYPVIIAVCAVKPSQ